MSMLILKMIKYLNIALPIPLNNLFTYQMEVPDQSDLIGCRAIVQFGKRRVTGVIVEQSDSPPESVRHIKKIIELLDKKPVYSNELLQLTKWIADYYMCSWGDSLKAALPSVFSPKTLMSFSLSDNVSSEKIQSVSESSKSKDKIINYLLSTKSPVSIGRIEKELGLKSVHEHLLSLTNEGIINISEITKYSIQKKYVKSVILNDDIVHKENLQSILSGLDKKSPKQSAILGFIYSAFIKTNLPLNYQKLLADTKVTSSVLASLEKKEFIKIIDVEVDRTNDDNSTKLAFTDESLLALTEEQNNAYQKIKDSIDLEQYKPFLLHGVTGSGKTLVYMQAIKHALNKGKSSLLLVPEISLTPQLIDRFKNVFGNIVVALHSKISDGERFDAWRKITAGEKKIVIGARSSIFAPLLNLGLIIVDEEHESSYKQDSPSPRYHGRDAALIRGRIGNATVVLGSATPSLESRYNAENGKLELLEIKNRADGAVLPQIKVINKITEKKSDGLIGSFSKSLIDSIIDTVNRKEGVILFHNRRGFSSQLYCGDCGYIPECKHCDVTLTFHKKKKQLICHYCGYTISSFISCPACGYHTLEEVGSGTQRFEDELPAILKESGIQPIIERLDLDSTSKKGALRNILNRFFRGETDILIGTQMVAKGLDFSRVTLVGVINADLQLFLPDFRANERTFQLLTQVSGRAGRKADKPGNVIIQTSNPQNPAIQGVLNGSYEEFYQNELKNRMDAGYPPFTRFVAIEISGKNDKQVHKAAQTYFEKIPDSKYFTKLGPTIPLIPRIRDVYRQIIIIKGDKVADPLGNILRKGIKRAEKEYSANFSSSTIKITIDIDSFHAL